VHTDALPTALASRADHYWLTGPRRYMTVLEVCRTFGLSDGSPLTAALRRVRCPTNAVSMAGRGIHAGVATAVLRWLDARALLPAHPTYASSCSGVDFFAAALHERGAFAYMHAAECDKQCRAVLMDAWGLAAARIHEDAASAAARTAAHVDLYVASPSCVDFSARRHGRDDAVVAEGALDANSTVGFILDGRARVVVVENVAERDGVAAITTKMNLNAQDLNSPNVSFSSPFASVSSPSAFDDSTVACIFLRVPFSLPFSSLSAASSSF